jgi:hypothetical protein
MVIFLPDREMTVEQSLPQTYCIFFRAPFLLVPKSILFPAVRALPGDGIAGHAPNVLRHTVLTDTKSAAAPPAKGKFPAAAVAKIPAALAMLLPVSGFGG